MDVQGESVTIRGAASPSAAIGWCSRTTLRRCCPRHGLLFTARALVALYQVEGGADWPDICAVIGEALPEAIRKVGAAKCDAGRLGSPRRAAWGTHPTRPHCGTERPRDCAAPRNLIHPPQETQRNRARDMRSLGNWSKPRSCDGDPAIVCDQQSIC